jgi:hypothetical protein
LIHKPSSNFEIHFWHICIQIGMFSLSQNAYDTIWICSMDNLCKDIFLRSKMDDQGFIPVSVIANFNRVSMLQTYLVDLRSFSLYDFCLVLGEGHLT